MKSHRGTLILVLGILSLIVCGPILGLPAWLMGRGDLRDMDVGQMDPSGRDVTKVGMILGMISTALFAVGCLVFVGLLILGGLGAVLGTKSH